VPLSAGGELKSSNEPDFQETYVSALENNPIRENLLRALDVAAASGASTSDKGLLIEKWQLYRVDYLIRSDDLNAPFDEDIAFLGGLYTKLDRNDINKLDTLLKGRVHECDNNLKKQTEFPGLEPTSAEYLNELLRMCDVVKPQYDNLLQTIACGELKCPELKLAELKDPERFIGKARLGYCRNYSCLLDIIRGSFICDDVRDMLCIVERFLDAVEGEDPRTWQVVRYKNRFTLGDASKSRGYRDLNMNVRHIPTGIVTEVQFHVRSFFEYDTKARGHKKYEFVRCVHGANHFSTRKLTCLQER
jgi:hypothetical protein